jgi:hypothetical protein
MTSHLLEIAAELLIYQCVYLVGPADLNHKGFLSTLLMLGCHYQVV